MMKCKYLFKGLIRSLYSLLMMISRLQGRHCEALAEAIQENPSIQYKKLNRLSRCPSAPCLIPLLLCASILLSSCGFKPLYGHKGPMSEEICKIEVAHIGDDRVSHNMYNKIRSDINLLCAHKNTQKSYNLKIKISHNSAPILFARTGDTKRNSFNLNANIELLEKNTTKMLYKFSEYNTDSFNTLDSPFNEYVASNNASNNAITGISNKILAELSMYFRDK